LVSGQTTPDPDRLLERTAVTADGLSSVAKRVPLTFAEIADNLVGSRSVLEAGGVFTPNLLDRVITLLRA
jgi:hypothetical protein